MAERASDELPADIVVFDLGGVLVQIVRSWAEAHERSGLPPHPIMEDERFIRETRPVAAAHQVGEITPDVWAERVARASRGAYTPDDALRVLRAWSFAEYPGVDALVDAIDASGVGTGALSNTNALHWRDLVEDPAETRFPTVRRLRHAHASHLLRLAKPDPAIFRAFEREAGFDPGRIVFFDDLAENVEAARAAGWQAEHVDYRGDTAEQMHAHLRRMRVIE